MKVVIQRVDEAQVLVSQKCVGAIKEGLLVFLGLGLSDTQKEADILVKKILALRIFERNQKLDQSVTDKDFELLIVSQFTLYADTSKGNRPSFIKAADPIIAKQLYEYFIDQVRLKRGDRRVATGVFGADMKIKLTNNGPFTIALES